MGAQIASCSTPCCQNKIKSVLIDLPGPAGEPTLPRSDADCVPSAFQPHAVISNGNDGPADTICAAPKTSDAEAGTTPFLAPPAFPLVSSASGGGDGVEAIVAALTTSAAEAGPAPQPAPPTSPTVANTPAPTVPAPSTPAPQRAPAAFSSFSLPIVAAPDQPDVPGEDDDIDIVMIVEPDSLGADAADACGQKYIFGESAGDSGGLVDDAKQCMQGEGAQQQPVPFQGGTQFTISVDKSTSGKKLGLMTKMGNGGMALKVAKIRDTGLVAEWNDANPDQEVRVGDAIIEVNGKRGKQGDRDLLYQAIAATNALVLVLHREQEEQWVV